MSEMSNKRKYRFRDVLYPVAPGAQRTPENREPFTGLEPRRPEPSQNRPELLRGDVAGTVGQVHTMRGFGASKALLHVNGDDRNPELITLQAMASSSDDSAPEYAVTFVLKYGTGGAQHQAKVSVGHGTQITLAATGISVSAMLEPLYPSQADPEKDVQISVGFASGARPAPSPLYVRAIELAAGANAIVPVAAFAHDVIAYSNPGCAGDDIDYLAPGATLLATYRIVSNAEASNGYRLLPNATDVRYTNNGVAAKTIFVCYRLAL